MSKSKRGFNLLDVLIVLALLFLVACILWGKELTRVVERQEMEQATDVLCTCTLGEGYDSETVLPEKGTKLYFDGEEVGVFMGEVMPAAPELSEEISNEGEPAEDIAIEEQTYVAIRFHAVEKKSGYYLNDLKLTHGSELTLYTDLYEFAVCISAFE